MMKYLVAALVVCLAVPAGAQEPVGCDKFKWNVDKERALLAGPETRNAASGAEIDQPLAAAVKVALVPYADAKLPMDPERKPKQTESLAGFVRFAAPPRGGDYRVTLSEAAWIDVLQDGKYVKSGPFSGVLGCEGIRKTVTFTLAALPFTVQVSSVTPKSITVAITSAGE